MTTPKVLSAIHNLPRRMKGGHVRDRQRPPGKENITPGENGEQHSPYLYGPAILITSPSTQVADRQKWLPKDEMIIIKVAIPFTHDIWKFRVPQSVTLETFLARVQAKIGFRVVFASKNGNSRERPITTNNAFKLWVAGRIRAEDGRNTPLVAHVLI